MSSLARASTISLRSLQATSTTLNRIPRRFAGAAYANMKVKKNNWVEQNEIMRENQFYNWNINRSNIVGLISLALIVPFGYRYLYMKELEARESKNGEPVRDRI